MRSLFSFKPEDQGSAYNVEYQTIKVRASGSNCWQCWQVLTVLEDCYEMRETDVVKAGTVYRTIVAGASTKREAAACGEEHKIKHGMK